MLSRPEVSTLSRLHAAAQRLCSTGRRRPGAWSRDLRDCQPTPLAPVSRHNQSCQTPYNSPNNHSTGGSSAPVWPLAQSGRGPRDERRFGFLLKVMRWIAHGTAEGIPHRSSGSLHALAWRDNGWPGCMNCWSRHVGRRLHPGQQTHSRGHCPVGAFGRTASPSR